MCGAVCAPYECSRCLKATYCSVLCQRKDWPTHKAACTPSAGGVSPPEAVLLSVARDENTDMVSSTKAVFGALSRLAIDADDDVALVTPTRVDKEVHVPAAPTQEADKTVDKIETAEVEPETMSALTA